MVALAQKKGVDGQFLGLVHEAGDAVIQALADGCSLETAAHCAGVSESVVHEWFARADGKTQRGAQRGDPDGIYAAWALRARQAKGKVLRKVTMRLVTGEGAATKGEHFDRCPVEAQNDRFILERRDKGWRRDDKHEHQIGPSTGSIEIILED